MERGDRSVHPIIGGIASTVLLRAGGSTLERAREHADEQATDILVLGPEGDAMPGVPGQPLYSSKALPWQGFLLERHQLMPDALPPAVSPTHILGIPLTQTPPSSFTWRVQGKTLCGTMQPERVYLRAAGEEFSCAWIAPLDIIFLSVEEESIAWACDMLAVKGSQMLRTRLDDDGCVDEGLWKLICLLDQHARGLRVNGSLFEESLLLACSLKLVERYRADGRALELPARSGALPMRKLRVLLDFIWSNLSQPITLDAMAQAVHLSAYHLCRQFRKTLSISLWQYVLRCRVAYASRLILRHLDMPLADVASVCGFESYKAFYAAFQKVHAVAPSRFRASPSRPK